ncbi:MAG: hypothetical protein AB7N53_14465 [Candidatus Binatia bacterium]
MSKLSPYGGWYNVPSHAAHEDVMAEKRRQLQRWEKFWRPEYDALIVRCIDKWGAAWIHQRKRLTEEISASLASGEIDRKMMSRLFDYAIHRVWNRTIPGAMEKWDAAYRGATGKSYRCCFCGVECNTDWARDELYEIEGASPTMCKECGYIWTRHTNPEQLERRENLCRRIRTATICERCGHEYRPLDNLYKFVGSLRVTHVQLFVNMCAGCVAVTSRGRTTDDVTEPELVLLRDFVEFLGQVPRDSIVGWQDFAYNVPNAEAMRELLRFTAELPSPRSLRSRYGSVFAALVAANVFQGGARRMTRGTMLLANDGHRCTSLVEAEIDNWLTANGIAHTREPTYPGHKLRADWQLHRPEASDTVVYVEYFGLAGDPEYDAKTEQKTRLAMDAGIHLIAIQPGEDFRKKILSWQRTPDVVPVPPHTTRRPPTPTPPPGPCWGDCARDGTPTCTAKPSH